MTPTPPPAPLRRALRLEYATVAWNLVEMLVAIGLGVAAGSLALIAFGLDSLVEIFASAVALWHLRAAPDPQRTRRALRLVALAFLGLAVLLLVGAAGDLLSGRRAGESLLGIAYLAVTAVVMFSLGVAKRRVSVRLDDHPLSHEARVTLLDGALACGVLLALAGNAVLGWWWADPLAAAGIGVVAISEGIAAPREH